MTSENIFSESMTSNLLFGNCPSNTSRFLGYKIRPLIHHFNAAFGEALSPDSEQSIDEHMTKFKGKHTCKQYLQLKPMRA